MKTLTYHQTVLPAMHYDTRDIFDEIKADNIERLWIERENIIKDIINTPHFVAMETVCSKSRKCEGITIAFSIHLLR